MDQIKKAFVFFLSLFASLLCFAQVNHVGKVDSYKKITGGIEGKGNGYIFNVQAWSDHVFRVRISKNKTFTCLPYALESTVIPSFQVKVSESGKTIELSTAAVTAIIEKEPALEITFRNTKDEIINQDATDYS